MMLPRQTVSVIATVLNEGDHIHRLMRSLSAQTRLPDEVVIVDGGSRDQTAALIQTYADRLTLRLLVEPGCNISAGRNRAIAAAQGAIIAATDAGVDIAPDWLEKLIAPFEAEPAAQVVGGFFTPAAESLFELAMGATVLPLLDEIQPQTFLPSSRSVAFLKTAWSAAGGYPEWLDYCEDLIFDFRLRQVVGAFAFAPGALVAFRPRGSLRSFFKQYYRYARGDGKADLWRKRHAARYLTYLMAAPLLLLAAVLLHPAFWLLLLAGAVVYLRQPYQRLPRLVRLLNERQQPPLHGRAPSLREWLYCWALLPVIRVVGDVAKMIGYPAGWRWRMQNHPPQWKG
jgi:glycosyltransferase involved in cell wall biosynthesis